MRAIYLFLLSIFIVLYSACTPTVTMVDTSCPGYKSVDFDREHIQQFGIGIMPVLGGDQKEQYRRPMGDALTKSLRETFGVDKTLSPNQVISALNESNLSDEYTKAISDYNISGILPKDMVKVIGQKLEVPYLLYTKLLADVNTELVATGSMYQVMQFEEIYVQCQVWSTEIGDVVWEGKGGIAKLSGNPTDIISRTAVGLANVLGKERSDGPCNRKQDLVNEIQKAKANTYWAVILGSSFFSLLLSWLII
jgi:hypothetical protein